MLNYLEVIFLGNNSPLQASKDGMYAKFEHKPDRIFTDFREIRKEIENRTKELVQNKNVCF